MASYHSHTTTALPPRLDIDTRARSHFYQPPATPSASNSLQSSMVLSASIESPPLLVASNTSRKRSRNEFVGEQTSSMTPQWGRHETPGTLSPAPFVNTRYRLADGGLDTPTGAMARSTTFDVGTPDVAFRRGRRYNEDHTNNHQDNREGYFDGAVYGRPSLSRTMSAPAPESQNGWSRAMYATAVAVAGSVWSFCTTPFRGFAAGGGRAYPHEPFSSSAPCQSSTATPSSPQPFGKRDIDTSGWFDAPPSPSSAPRGAKRSKIVHGYGDDDLRGWVLVPSEVAARAESPSSASAARMRKPPAATKRAAPSAMAYSPRLASAAGLRSPASQLRPSPRNGHARRENRDRLLGQSPRTSAALVTGASRQSGAGVAGAGRAEEQESPIAKETAKYVQKMRKREREENRGLKKLNRRLEDMIREGQEALGARVEVLDTDDDRESDEMMWT